MLERLVGRLLNNVLSQYFVYNNNGNTDPSTDPSAEAGATSPQPSLGVWSGYIALDNLQLRTEVINDLLEQRGIPLEVLHCTIRRVEITVPWSKLNQSTAVGIHSNSNGNNNSGAVVVIVMDGIHILARTLYEYNDEKMRHRDVQQRRAKLQEAQAFEHSDENNNNNNNNNNSHKEEPSQNSWYSLGGLKNFVKRRMSEGLLQQIADKLHVHIRDLHVRLEDAETDPHHPFACGIIMESMHVQHSDDMVAVPLPAAMTTPGSTPQRPGAPRSAMSLQENGDIIDNNGESTTTPTRTTKEVIRKVAQVNHYAIYWNALGYEEGLPLEHSVMHRLPSLYNSQLRAAALDRGIARRASSLLSSTTGVGHRMMVPVHNYLLLPMDCSLQAVLSIDPTGQTKTPSIEATVHVDAINVQLRDFQCHQVALLIGSMKEHRFTKKYRTFRPQVTVHENPGAWWRYAFRVVSHELKGSRLRWSWGRMRQKYAGRHRYCELYERRLKFNFYAGHESGTAQHGSLSALVESSFDTTPDDGAGPTLTSDTNSTTSLDSQQQQPQQEGEAPRALTDTENREFQELEDGLMGDMSVEDILLYRLLVHNRLGQGFQAQQQQAEANQTLAQSWVLGNSMVKNAMRDDIECQLEVQRLTAYLEHSATVEASNEDGDQERQNDVFLSISFHWKEGCLALFSPLPSMANEPSLLRRLHERILDFTFEKQSFSFSMMGDYETMKIAFSLSDYRITEIRSNQEQKKYPILSRRIPCEGGNDNGDNDDGESRRSLESKVSFSRGEFAGGDADTASDNIQRQSLALSPLISVEVGLNPPQQEGCRVTVKANIEKVEVVLVPDCQWIRRLKEFLGRSTASGSGKIEDYWKGLNYASMNAWASKSLGLRAKAETAMEDHKSINLDIFLHCPIIQIFGTENEKVWIDIGSAHLKTVKLAGVSSKDLKIQRKGKLSNGVTAHGGASVARNISNALDRAAKSAGNFIDSDRSVNQGFLSSSPGLQSYLEGPTMGVSFDNQTATSPMRPNVSSRKRSSTGIGNSGRSVGWFDDDRTAVSAYAGKQEDAIHSSFFYDVYQLQIKTGESIVGEWCDSRFSEARDPLLARFQIQVNIHKSIIPADHTLCRFRIDCILSDIAGAVSPTTITHLSSIMQTWKTVMKAPPDSSSQKFSAVARSRRLNRHASLGGSEVDFGSEQDESNPQSASVGNGSRVDEDEFFDAVENDENSENVSMWLEDNWIADADSVLGGNSSTTNRQRRHKTAMSDVSSLSDRSLTKRRKKPKDAAAYLSAENLAMLTEGMIEEDSLEDDNESDSFHSAVSPGNIAELVGELDTSIQEARSSLNELANKLSDLSQPRKNQLLTSTNSDSSKNRRLLKKSLKLEQERLRVELNEMVATRYDLSIQLAAMEVNGEDRSLGGNSRGADDAGVNVRRASLLLSGRKNLDKSFAGTATHHNLTSNLNPQLVQCSVVLSKLSITISDMEASDGDGCIYESTLCLSQAAFALRHSTNETKVFLSVEHVNASYRNQQEPNSQERYIFLGGSQYYSLASSMLPSHFPQFISSASMEEKFMKCTLELRHRPASKNALNSPEIVRLRTAFGDLEVTPQPKLLETWAVCANKMRQNITGSEPRESTVSPAKQAKTIRAFPAYLDVTLQLASMRLVLSHDGKAVAALTLTEIGARFAQSSANTVYKSRHQLDISCSNLQCLHIEDLNLGRGSEIVGRKDAFQPLLQVRVRSQLVPSSNLGGWAAGFKASTQEHPSSDEEEVWNVHAGARVNSLRVTAASEAILPIRFALADLLRIESLLKRKESDTHTVIGAKNGGDPDEHVETSLVTNEVELDEKVDMRRPIRWRADLAIRKTTVVFLGQDGNDWDPRDGPRNSLVLTWTLLASVEDSLHKEESVSMKVALTDVSLVRSTDELHVLEPLDLLLQGDFQSNARAKRPLHPNLMLPADSPWNEVCAVLHRHGWDASTDESHSTLANSLALLVTPTKVNLSAQLCAFLAETLVALTRTAEVRAEKKIMEVPMQENSKGLEKKNGRGSDFYVLVSLRSVDLVLFRETTAKSTDSFASFQVINMDVALHKNNQSLGIEASVVDAFVFDLSCRPGVNGLARRYYRREHENETGLHRDILSVSASFAESNGTTVAKVNLHFGNMRCIVLPSLLQGILTFKADATSLLPERKKDSSKGKKDRIEGGGPAQRPIDFFFSFQVDGFDCVFPSKDISNYVREQGQDAINVVSLRWTSSGEAMFVYCSMDEAAGMMEKLAKHGGGSAKDESGQEFVSLVEHHAPKVSESQSRIFASKILLSVNGFQVLRTCILPLRRTEKDATPYFFKVFPPTAGEQLITNSVDFNFSYRAFGARLVLLLTQNDGGENDAPVAVAYEYAHSLRLEAQLVELLLYIAQSAGGISDAISTTARPVVEMLTRKEQRNTNATGDDSEASEPGPHHPREPNSLARAIKKAALLCSVKADGIRVTCVPGGATRLTESPIVTFSLRNFKLGLAICPVPVEAKLMADSAIEGFVENKAVVASLQEQQHLMSGAWLHCELSASYNNRSLVAWEPLIEPWTMEVRFGADLVKLLKLPPTVKSLHEDWHSQVHQGETAGGYTGERLRDIRNLLRSPFRKSVGDEIEADEAIAATKTKRFPIESDFGYLLLVLASNALAADALLPSISATKDTVLSLTGALEAFLPSRNPLKWLVCFGHPRGVHDDNTNTLMTPVFSCAVSDVKPLNINLTGALIENVLGYLKQEKSRTSAPHWIRNDSGLVSLGRMLTYSFDLLGVTRKMAI